MRGTMIFQVHLEILSGQYRGLATMRTRNRKSAAFRMMSAERIEDKFFVTITTSDQPLGAFAQLVLTDVSPLHLHAAFILAIQRLVAACSRVLLQKYISIVDFSLRCEIIIDIKLKLNRRILYCTSKVCPVNSLAQKSQRALRWAQVYFRWSSMSTRGIIAPHLLPQGTASCLHVFRCA